MGSARAGAAIAAMMTARSDRFIVVQRRVRPTGLDLIVLPPANRRGQDFVQSPTGF